LWLVPATAGAAPPANAAEEPGELEELKRQVATLQEQLQALVTCLEQRSTF
jgi:hypothetical protein